MMSKPILNLYERKVSGKTLVFAEQSSSLNKDTGNTMLTGIVVSPDNIVSVDMNYDNMLSRGWRKVDHPLLSLRDMMQKDANNLRRSETFSMRTVVPDIIECYANLLNTAISNTLINNLENK